MDEMTSYAYFRALAAQPAAPQASAARGGASRVKLVFLDELAAFVHRQRGFTACWYLVPRSAKLVGDLIHEITHEFELTGRCPQGVELLLDGFHVMANQDIDMVRDNDALAVQCVAFVGDAVGPEEEPTKKRNMRQMNGDECEANDGSPTKKKKKVKRSADAGEKKIETTKLGSKAEKKTSTVSPAAVKKPLAAALRSSSDSSSDSSDSDDDKAPQPRPVPLKEKKHAFRAAIQDAVKEMSREIAVTSATSSNTATSSSSSSSDSDSDSDSDSSSEDEATKTKSVVKGKLNGRANAKPSVTGEAATRTRRRRRPRRRPKNDGAALAATPKPPNSKTTGKAPAPQAAPVQLPVATATTEIRPLRIRGVPQTSKQNGKSHMRFDGPSTKPVEMRRAPERIVATDLEKYGPQSSKPQSVPLETMHADGEQDDRSSHETTTKKPYKEMWKRPYEIISSIHDSMPNQTTGKPSVDSLLAEFPTKPSSATGSGLQTDDVVAYKTLTLCMETFQPVVSDWQCGQVVDVLDADGLVTLIPYSWSVPSAHGGKLAWQPTHPHAGEDASVSCSLSEISELRYLKGPTQAKAASANAAP